MRLKIIKNTTNPCLGSSTLFINCVFREYKEYGSDCFNSCSFQDCLFLNIALEKCVISNCEFSNCEFVGASLHRGQITNTSFINTKFIDTNMSQMCFTYCQMRNPKFIFTVSDYCYWWFSSMSASDLELWKLNELTEIEEVRNDLGAAFEVLNLVSFPDT